MEVRYPPPPKKGHLSDTCAIPIRQMDAIPSSAILFRKGIARYGGGISHWAAKGQKRGSLPSENAVDPRRALEETRRGQREPL